MAFFCAYERVCRGLWLFAQGPFTLFNEKAWNPQIRLKQAVSTTLALGL